jgi:hypothetical protein
MESALYFIYDNPFFVIFCLLIIFIIILYFVMSSEWNCKKCKECKKFPSVNEIKELTKCPKPVCPKCPESNCPSLDEIKNQIQYPDCPSLQQITKELRSMLPLPIEKDTQRATKIQTPDEWKDKNKINPKSASAAAGYAAYLLTHGRGETGENSMSADQASTEAKNDYIDFLIDSGKNREDSITQANTEYSGYLDKLPDNLKDDPIYKELRTADITKRNQVSSTTTDPEGYLNY